MGLRELSARTVTRTINIGGNDGIEPWPLSITFRPAAYTAEFEAALLDHDRENRNAAGLVEVLVSFLDSWDLKWTDSDKKPIPITREELSKIDIFSMKAIVDGILEGLAPDPPTRK